MPITIVEAVSVADALTIINAASGSAVGIPAFSDTNPKVFLGVGQSLILGTQGTSPLTTTNPFGAPTPQESSNFTDLVETTLERPISAGVFQIRDGDATREYIGGAIGSAGAAIESDIREPSTVWTTLENRLDTIDSNRAAASFVAVPWVHGHADAATAEGYYSAQLVLIQSELNAEAAARLTGQGSREVVLFLCQGGNVCQPLTTQDFSYVPYEMFEAWESDKTKFVLVCPMYAFFNTLTNPYQADGTHMTAAGYRALAELWGEAARRIYVSGDGWEPLHILSAEVQNTNEILITFSEDIVVDTTAVLAAPAYGPTLWGIHLEDAGPQPEVIESITTSGSNALVATCSGAPHDGATIWTGKMSKRTAHGGPGATAAQWGSPRTNIRSSFSFTGSESGDTLHKWAVLQRRALTGGIPQEASDGTVTQDLRWTAAWAAQNNNPAIMGDWDPIAGGVTLPYLSGALLGNQSTAGLNDDALGSTLVDEGFDNTLGQCWRITDAGEIASVSDINAEEVFVFRFIGNIQRPGGSQYIYHKGGFSGDRIIILALATGNVSVTIATSEGTRTAAAAAILPAVSTLGMLEVAIYHDAQQRLVIQISADGTVETSTPSAFPIGAVTGLTPNFFCAANGSAPWTPALACFFGLAIGHKASWWTPESYAAHNTLLLAP